MKKIFLFGHSMFGYEEIIIKELRKKGYYVDFFDYSNPELRKKFRTMNNLFLNLYNNLYLKRVKKINLKDKIEMKNLNKYLLQLSKEYDIFIKIGPYTLQESTMKILQEKFKVLISHHWDKLMLKDEEKIKNEKKIL